MTKRKIAVSLLISQQHVMDSNIKFFSLKSISEIVVFSRLLTFIANFSTILCFT